MKKMETTDKRVVLLVEDNEKLNEINRRALESEGYEVPTAATLTVAREHLSRRAPDVILLDVVLPDGSGMDLCKEIRQDTDAHILFLTSRREHEQMLLGLLLGGDDYITKPFRMSELLHRVASAMRRRAMIPHGMPQGMEDAKTLKAGGLTLNVVAGRAFMNDADLQLQPKEFALLRMFVQNENKIMSAETLYEEAWGQSIGDDKRSLQKRISALRKKLEEANSGYTVNVEYGQGYCFEKNLF